MRTPEDALAWARQRFSNQKRRWLDGAGDWPLSLSLERPSEAAAIKNWDPVRTWSGAWAAWRAPTPEVTIETVALKWPNVGAQNLPNRICFSSPTSLARFIGEDKAWLRVTTRRDQLLARWPVLAETGLGVHFDLLAGWSDLDFTRLISLLDWFQANPRSGLYLRQIPLHGIDTKWIDVQRRGVVSDFLSRLRGRPVNIEDSVPLDQDFYERCGLLRPTARMRLLLLSPELRHAAGGLRDIEAPLEQLQAMDLAPSKVLIIENLETAYCLPDFPGTAAFVKLGNAVSLAGRMPWLRGVPIVYWGDIDTHGFNILALARKSLRNLSSVLMDEETLTIFRERCVPEPVQTFAADVGHLTPDEVAVYKGLLGGTWCHSVRLEQERLDWEYCVHHLHKALG